MLADWRVECMRMHDFVLRRLIGGIGPLFATTIDPFAFKSWSR